MRCLILALLCCSFLARAQSSPKADNTNILDLTLDGSEQGKGLNQFLLDLESKRDVRFYFMPEWIAAIVVRENYSGKTLGEMLDAVLGGTDLAYISIYPDAVAIIRDPTQAIRHRMAIEKAMRERKKIQQRSFGDPAAVVKGKRVNITGKVTDTRTKEPMVGVNIRVSDSQEGTTTDEKGQYSISVDQGGHVLNFTFLDYEEKVVDVAAFEDAVIDIDMEEIPMYLEEVVVTDRAAREVSTNRIGQTQITIKEIKRSPAMLGEADLIRNVQMLPGVTTVGEAASGFNVRGGSVDQNLVMYDGMPMFNSSHVFGFLSTFNPEAIRDVSFYRGGIPAEFGGRASSVLEIRARDGDFEKWNGNAGIGMITGNFMINGPLRKGSTSISASLRSTYSDWLIHSIKSNYGNLKKSSVFFYDGTLKLTHMYNPRTKLSVTGYSSKDSFRLIGDSTYQWRNAMLSVRLDHQFASGLQGEFVLGESYYGYDLLYGFDQSATRLGFGIASTAARAGFHHQIGKHKLNFGWQATYYRFNPGSQEPDSKQSTSSKIALDKQNSIETAFYIADNLQVSSRAFIEAGLRLPVFSALGPATIYTYSSERRDVTTVSDTIEYRDFRGIKTYVGLEPRLALRWMTGAHSSVKAGYSRVYQYLHLVTNTAAVSPIDIWQPSGRYFRPQIADQFSLGYFVDLKDNMYSLSGEGFYKFIDNLVDFKDGAQLILNRHIETELLQGKGWSYGGEASVSKNSGNLTGSVNYTYARSFRQFAGPSVDQSISEGKVYPSNYDQPHIVNLTWKIGITKRHFFTGNFTYHTGRPITVPVAAFTVDNIPVAYFSERNQYRVPDYHRLDLALVIEGTHKRKKLGDGTWVFSLYNVYARKNVYTVFFRSGTDGVPKPYQLAIIGTILPSVSYNLKF
jgi:hypothetical protein